MAASYHRLRPRSAAGMQIEILLCRYPHLSDHELARLIDLMAHLPMLDQFLITADDRLAARLTDFLRDHGNEVKPSASDRLALLVLPAVVGGLALWWALAW